MKIRFDTDPELSLRGKGCLVVCKQLLDKGINPTIENIKKNGLDAERSISTCLHELDKLGYYKAIKYKPETPGFAWRFEVSETREVS